MTFLVVENSPEDRELLRALVEHTESWRYDDAETVADGLQKWSLNHPNVVLQDISFQNRPDSEAYNAMRTMSKISCVIAYSGTDSQEAVSLARDAGAIAFINKKSITSAKAFHDAIHECVRKNLFRGHPDTIKTDQDALVLRLAEAVFYGNGKPSMVAQLEAGAVKMDDMDKKLDLMVVTQEGRRIEVDTKFSDIAKGQDDTRRELKLYALLVPILGIVAIVVLNIVAMQKGFHSLPVPIPNFTSKASE